MKNTPLPRIPKVGGNLTKSDYLVFQPGTLEIFQSCQWIKNSKIQWILKNTAVKLIAHNCNKISTTQTVQKGVKNQGFDFWPQILNAKKTVMGRGWTAVL